MTTYLVHLEDGQGVPGGGSGRSSRSWTLDQVPTRQVGALADRRSAGAHRLDMPATFWARKDWHRTVFASDGR